MHDGVNRRCADRTARGGVCVQFQRHPLNRRQQVKARGAVVGHSQEVANLFDVQSDDPAQGVGQFEALEMPCRVPGPCGVGRLTSGQQTLAKVVLDAGGRDPRLAAQFLEVGSYIGIAVAFFFAVAVPGRTIPRLLAEDTASAVFVAGLVVLTVLVVFVSLQRGGRTGAPQGSKRRRPLTPRRQSPTHGDDPATRCEVSA